MFLVPRSFFTLPFYRSFTVPIWQKKSSRYNAVRLSLIGFFMPHLSHCKQYRSLLTSGSMLSSQLHATTDVLPVAGLDRLAEHSPLAWIEQALSATGMASIRRRRLATEQVVWLVIALAFYRHQSMPEVLATLDLALPSDDANHQQERRHPSPAAPGH